MNTPEKTSSRWKKLDELLDAVIDLPEDQRSAFLDQACAGNDALRKQIDELLKFDDKRSSFIQAPAFQILNPELNTSGVTSLFEKNPEHAPFLHSGKLIAGRYEISRNISPAVWIVRVARNAQMCLRFYASFAKRQVTIFGRKIWSILDILKPDAIITHAQITNVYLLGLAVQNKGKLATLDQRVPADAVRDGVDALEILIH